MAFNGPKPREELLAAFAEQDRQSQPLRPHGEISFRALQQRRSDTTQQTGDLLGDALRKIQERENPQTLS